MLLRHRTVHRVPTTLRHHTVPQEVIINRDRILHLRLRTVHQEATIHQRPTALIQKPISLLILLALPVLRILAAHRHLATITADNQLRPTTTRLHLRQRSTRIRTQVDLRRSNLSHSRNLACPACPVCRNRNIKGPLVGGLKVGGPRRYSA